MANHKYTAMIHARCPVNGSWDYYEVMILSPNIISCETIHELCNNVRGTCMLQENIAQTMTRRLEDKLDGDFQFSLQLQGVHPNGVAVCTQEERRRTSG